MKRLSVIITNYNYGQYVSQAVQSALALHWDDLEVVVVDDGSTDDSLEVLQRHVGSITLLSGPNRGQRAAANRGFAASTGDVIVFLDADDVLPPQLPERLAGVWGPSVSKVQFRMQRIDADGRPVGRPFPAWRRVPEPVDVRRWITKTSAYPTPPGSANAYARWFLGRIFPLDPSIGDFADSGCLAAAPFHGDVVSVPDVIVGYRQHGANDSDLLADHTRFAREIERARARWRFAHRSIGVDENAIDDRPLARSRELLQFRVAAVRLTDRGKVLPGDGRMQLLLDSLRSPLQPGPERVVDRLLIAAWCLTTLIAPSGLARRLVLIRWRRS